MIIIYTQQNSQACKAVVDTLNERLVTYEDRDIGNEEYKQEFLDKGGKKTPFLVDTTANVVIHDEGDMLDYASEYSF